MRHHQRGTRQFRNSLAYVSRDSRELAIAKQQCRLHIPHLPAEFIQRQARIERNKHSPQARQGMNAHDIGQPIRSQQSHTNRQYMAFSDAST